MANLIRLLTNKWIILIIIVAIGSWWWLGNNGTAGGDKKPAANAVRISVAEAKRQDLPQQLLLVGAAVAYETVTIKSRVDSQITAVAFRDGDYVKEGQVLFELDDRAIQAQIKQLEANLAKDKAQLVNAKLQYERALKLVKTSAVSQSRVDDTRAAYQAQLAQVGATQASLDNSSVQLTYTHIMAPISGRAGTINVTRGNNVKANDTQALVTINRIMPIRVQFAIPQRYYDQVKSVMAAGTLPVSASRSESKESSQGVLDYLDNAIDATNGTFAARASFENADETLWPGMFVNVALELGLQKNVLTVPAVAIQGDEAKRFVFVLDKEGKKAIRKAVEVSQINGDVAAITSGIEEGDQVATDGLLRLTDGATVEIAKPELPKEATKENHPAAGEDKKP